MGWNIEGKTALVTGPTAGIGRATAFGLAKAGAEVVLLCRNREKGEVLASEIAAETGREPSLLVCDLSSQADVRRAAGEFLSGSRPIHVLVNNAGLVNMTREVTVEGIEATFAVNHLGHFLLTLLLLERIRESAPARIVNVSSEGHRFGKIDFDDLRGERKYGWLRMYGRSKLANVLFTRELARRLDGTRITVNCLHPGGVATSLGGNDGGFVEKLMKTTRIFLRTPEQGADTSIWLATSPGLVDQSGHYYANRKVRAGSARSRDPEVARKLWVVSENLTGLTST